MLTYKRMPTQSVSHESDQSFTLSSPHLDVRKVCSLPLALGGHGLLPFNLNPSPRQHSNSPINHSQPDLAFTHHHSAFFASWSATWSLIRAWSPPSGENPFHLPPTSLPTHHPCLLTKHQVLRTWLLINAASAASSNTIPIGLSFPPIIKSPPSFTHS